MSDARTWIGDSAEDDRLDLPELKARCNGAKALLDILASDRIARLFFLRREAADAAAAARGAFRRWSAVAILGTTLATFASGLLLYDAGFARTPAPPAAVAPAGAAAPPAETVPPADVPQLVRWVEDNRTPVIAIQVLGLFLAALATSFLSAQNFSQRWLDNRRKAELLRREVFLEVANAAAARVPAPLAAPDAGNPVAQALEFFRRYQHDLQIGFYRKGVRRHGRAATTLTLLTAVLAGCAAISGAIGAFGASALVVSAFLGIAVPVLLSAAQSWRIAGGDTDKASSYTAAREQLETIALDRLATVRERAALGDAAAVRAYMDEVHLVMTTENDAWSPVARTARAQGV